MSATHALAVFLAATGCLLAQEEPQPKVTLLSRIDGGLGGFLEFADGTRGEFHIEVSAIRSRLVDKRIPGDGRELAVGSADEAKVLRALDQWLDSTFTADEQKDLLALQRLPDPRTQDEDFAHQRAQLLRTVRRYKEVTRPQVTKVFAGRGTVSLSLQLQLGERPPQQLLWRHLGDESFARLHLDTEVEPVAIDSGAEGRLLLGIANWLAVRLGGREALWQPEPADFAEDVRLVLLAYRGYFAATTPRLRVAGTIMDAGKGGSKLFTLSDAQQTTFDVRFDYAAGTTTPGRLRDGGGRDAPVVDLGSPREAELLATLTRAVKLRRGWRGAKPEEDTQLVMLEAELAAYEKAFVQVGK